jgi:hypothetical protein
MRKPLFTVAAAVLLAACSGQDGEPGQQRTLTLAAADSIGVESGDSLYCLGRIDAMCHGPDGEILVLDGSRTRIARYSADGTFLNWIGREGEGPGELTHPAGIALLADGSLAVSDIARSRIVLFGQEGGAVEEIPGFVPFPPTRIRGSSEGIVGARREFDREAGTYGFIVALWNSDGGADLVYHSRMADFNRDNVQGTVNATALTFAASPVDGRVYVAPMSVETYRILVYSADGRLEEEISMDRDPVRRPAEEIAAEEEAMNRQLRREGAPPDMVWEARELEHQIAGLWVGPENRLWVLDGTTADPLFRVYSPQGRELFTCSVEGPAAGDWSYRIDSGGFLATQEDPLDCPRVYILSLQRR